MAGGFGWFDLRTTDQEDAQRFYEQLLGWEFAPQDADPTGAQVALWQAAE